MKYECCIKDWTGDQFEEVDGYDAEDAACNFAQKYNEDGDYPLMGRFGDGGSCWVLVREVGSEEIILCHASAEPDIRYSSCEVKTVKCNQCGKDNRERIITGGDMYDDRFCNYNCYKDWIADYQKNLATAIEKVRNKKT